MVIFLFLTLVVNPVETSRAPPKKQNWNMNYDNVASFLLDNSPEVTDEVVEYYRNHPDELSRITDKESFHLKFVTLFFGIGLCLTVGARVLTFFFDGQLGVFVNEVILDLMSELGIAIFGGAVTVYFLEILQKKQFEQNVRFREKVKSRLRESPNG